MSILTLTGWVFYTIFEQKREGDMEITQWIVWIGFVSGLFIGIPQIIKTIKTRNVEGVSAITFLLIEVTALCFLVRAIAIREYGLIAYYCFILIVGMIQLSLIVKFRKAKNVTS